MYKYNVISIATLMLLSGCAQMQAASNSGEVCGQAYQNGNVYKVCAQNDFKYKFTQGWCSNHKNGANPDLIACLINNGLTATQDNGTSDINIHNNP